MDYSQLSTPELQQECKRRGLPTGRAKADLVQRLADHDAAGGAVSPPEPDGAPPLSDGEPVLQPADAPPVAEPAPVPPASIQCTFPAGQEGPGEEEHLAYRQATIAAAADQGLTPHGDAYRVGTVDGHEVYEVNVRAVI